MAFCACKHEAKELTCPDEISIHFQMRNLAEKVE